MTDSNNFLIFELLLDVSTLPVHYLYMTQRHFELDSEDDSKLLSLCKAWKKSIAEALRKLIRDAHQKENR